MSELDPIPVTPGRQKMIDVYALALARMKAIAQGDIDNTKSNRIRIQAAEKIVEIQRQIKWLKKHNAEWAEKYIPDAYKYGMYQDEKLLNKITGGKYDRTFSMMHREAAMVAVEATVADFNILADAMEQTFVGYIRRVQMELSKQAIATTIAGGIVEGQGRQTIGKRLLDQMRDNVNNGMVTVGKVTMNAKRYSDLLARTLTRSARTDGVINTMKEYEIDLVQFNNTGAVDFCRIYEGQIFSLSGKSKRFPKLVYRPPLHPNCTHSIHGYVLELSDAEETEFGSQFKASDSELSIRELAKKYPVEKEDRRARTRKAA